MCNDHCKMVSISLYRVCWKGVVFAKPKPVARSVVFVGWAVEDAGSVAGWVGWGINLTGSLMPATQAVVAF